MTDPRDMDLFESCTACSEDRCVEMFVCTTCGRRLNACGSRVGGLNGKTGECSDCWELYELPDGWDHHLRAKSAGKWSTRGMR